MRNAVIYLIIMLCFPLFIACSDDDNTLSLKDYNMEENSDCSWIEMDKGKVFVINDISEFSDYLVFPPAHEPSPVEIDFIKNSLLLVQCKLSSTGYTSKKKLKKEGANYIYTIDIYPTVFQLTAPSTYTVAVISPKITDASKISLHLTKH